jgi:amino acid adenylation domain-containing protein
MTLNQLSAADAGPAGLLQTQIWLQEQIAGNSGAYNIPTALRIRGPLEKGALHESLNQIIARHEALRTLFLPGENGPRQLICPIRHVELAYRSLERLPQSSREAALLSELREETRRPFNLDRDLMLRAVLFRLSRDEHALLIATHHIASDGLSVTVLLNELKTLYESNLSGTPPGLPELPIQYADYAAWQREQYLEGRFNEQLEYWKRELQGDLPSLELPLDRLRSVDGQFEGAREQLDLPPSLCAAVQNAAREFRVTDFTILYSAFNALLARYCNQSELITGTVVAGRNRVELEPLIGFLVNLLILRVRIPPETTAAALFSRFQQKFLEAFPNQDVPFDQVVAALERPAGAAPLVQAIFALQDTFLEKTTWGPLVVEWIDTHNGTAKFDLSLTIHRSSTLSAVLEYRTALFDSTTIQRLLHHYFRLLESMLAAPGAPFWQLPILSPEEHLQVVESWNCTQTPYPRESTIGDVFHAQALATPRATALIFEDETLTYEVLDQRSDALATHLLATGAAPGQFIALCMERSLDLIVAMLAVIKSGAAYVPLDPDYPVERLEMLVRDCAAPIVLTHHQHAGKFRNTPTRTLELDTSDARGFFEVLANHRLPSGSPESPAYVMYTSGSTGVPKGVVIPHRAVLRLVKNTNFADLGPSQTFLQFAPASFDAATLEIWAPLLNGGKLCIAPPGKITLEDLGRIIRERGISTLWLTSALFNLMVEEQIDALKPLRQLLTGGDAASYSHFRKFHSEIPYCRLINGYGPTENTTFTACKTFGPDDLRQGIVPIGKPISNTQVYILDQFLRPVSIGVVGELFTGGDGLAREYLNAPELTAEKFLPHPFKPGQRIYRTGDRARFLSSGDIQFLGRLDHQVKIRGYRIEPGEIEHALRMHPAVRDAVVLMCGESQSDKHLVCCWIPQPPVSPAVTSDSLSFFLKQKLPDYFIPARLISLEKFPINANGKVDRRALRATVANLVDETAHSAPANEISPLEKTLLEIWRDVLKNPSIRPHEDFFQLGGHSLLATQLISRINKQLNLRLPLRLIFDHSTVAELALATRDLQHSAPEPIHPRSLPSF